MKYIKLFEGRQFKRGDYVKILNENDDELYKIYSISQNERNYILAAKNGDFKGHNVYGTMRDHEGDALEWTMWYKKEDLRFATELEIEAEKYNL